MRMTQRVEEIIAMNTLDFFIPLVLRTEKPGIFPMYYARLIGGKTLAFPVTDATGIAEILAEEAGASALVGDRGGGYEAYVLDGKARYVSGESDYELVAEVRSLVPGFPIRGAVLLEIEAVHLAPPP